MSPAYRLLSRLFRKLLGLFFRRVEVVGVEQLPRVGGGLLVSWHPNGLIDPALILTSCPRPIAVGARHGLFAWPLLGALLRTLGAVPIYRAVDAQGGGSETERAERNRTSLGALTKKLATGELVMLFPEGVSHDAPHLSELKTGAAKLYCEALASDPSPAPVILPVGLHYDHKAIFRSRALVVFHPPLVLPEALSRPLAESASGEERRARYAAITREIERTLVEVVHATESWELHALMHRTRQLFRAERAHRAGGALEEESMHERALGFARVWHGYEANRERRKQDTERLLARIAVYDYELRGLGMSDAELDRDPSLGSRHLLLLSSLQILSVYLLLPPILVFGFLANVVPYQLLRLVTLLSAKLQKDAATIKLFIGALLFPASWAAVGFGFFRGGEALHARYASLPAGPWASAAWGVVLSVLGGFLVMRYQELSARTLRSLRVRLTRRRRRATIERLRRERAEIFEALSEMVEGLALPGAVGRDGRVLPHSDHDALPSHRRPRG